MFILSQKKWQNIKSLLHIFAKLTHQNYMKRYKPKSLRKGTRTAEIIISWMKKDARIWLIAWLYVVEQIYRAFDVSSWGTTIVYWNAIYMIGGSVCLQVRVKFSQLQQKNTDIAVLNVVAKWCCKIDHTNLLQKDVIFRL